MNRDEGLSLGPSHPLTLSAVALLALNDLVLKQAWPGLLTGKLSDACWLLIGGVVVAALSSRAGLGSRGAKALALLSVGGVFTTLQLWPPLGDAWCAWRGCAHLADLGDLLALPALLLAPLVWSTPQRGWLARRLRPLAFPAAALALVATSPGPPDLRLPNDGEEAWDPGLPLFLDWSGGPRLPVNDPQFQAGFSLRGDDGHAPELAFGAYHFNGVLICPIGGLHPSTRYTWTAGPWEQDSLNRATIPPFAQAGTWSFTTAAEAELSPARSAAECRSGFEGVSYWELRPD
ncbi:MAG: hypothetical protein H6740_19675, partial [Alphaproteobacteria bacterium]|nr:hypothetical protein [Alphaproteobacteria bacterium]